MIINKDCLEALKTLPDNSIDAIVTDPPYHLVSVTKRFGGKNAHNTPAMETEEGGVFARKAKGFMGKDWDGVDETGLGIAQKVELWEECLRVLKPGGYVLAFSGTRTYHRMASAIEDAGFEVRDMIAWVYGSGFPKSLNLAKYFEKEYSKNVKEVSDTGASSTEKTNHVVGVSGTEAQPWDNNEYGGGNAKCSFCHKWLISGNPCKCPKEKVQYKSEQAKQWEGWGTALKPALEPITVARKPIEGTVAENCLKWGVGGINIDGCRVEHNEPIKVMKAQEGGNKVYGQSGRYEDTTELKANGRFPANLIHDGSDEVLELFPDTKTNSTGKNSPADYQTKSVFGAGYKSGALPYEGDSGSAARFFKNCEFNETETAQRFLYCPKASKSERNMGLDGFEEKEQAHSTNMKCGNCNLPILSGTGVSCECEIKNEIRNKQKNFHPTVKPIKLMEYLVNLVSKEGHTILDPFAGSGTTGIACKKLNRNFIGVERDPEYCKIAEARINAI